MQQHQNVVYFLFSNPDRLERYDLDSQMWLSDIALKEVATAFWVDDDGIFVAYDRRLSQYDLQGINESHIGNTLRTILWIQSRGHLLYFGYGASITTYDKSQGVEVDTMGYFPSLAEPVFTDDAAYAT